MKSFLNFHQGTEFNAGKRWVVFLLVFSVLVVFPLRNVLAQVVVTGGPVVTVDQSQAVSNVKTTIWQNLTKLLQKTGSMAFQRVLSSALNKIAYDTANYIGSGGKGQKPLFITKGLGAYMTQVADEAAGEFIESFVNNINTPVDDTCSKQMQSCRQTCLSAVDAKTLTECNTECDRKATRCAAQTQTTADQVTPSFNVCSPSSVTAKLRIGLGLVEQIRPQAPNCTASEIVQNWGDSIDQKLAALQDPNYLNTFVNIFDPRSNDVGIFVLANSDLSSQMSTEKNLVQSDFITNKGWQDVRDIAGNLKGVPGSAQAAADEARTARQQALGKTTGDILVDAANVFLNQLYFSAFNNLLQSLGSKTSGGNKASISAGSYEGDPSANVSATALKDITNTLLQPKFGVRADYDILSELSVCLDANNPGPTNCVIDNKFMQGIAEKKTVAEAIQEGYLHGDWQLTNDNREGAYSLRNIAILRKYRILPVGWEEAVNKAYADAADPKKTILLDYVSCFDPNDQYDTFSNTFNTRDQGWCQGLIDPNWVLKAPLNYCKKEGVGAQILSKMVIPGFKGSGGAADTLSELNISRSDSYCADNQTCIKEKSDGSCDAYGYCNEERRTWSFGSDSCQPINNTCQAFSNTDSGASVAYLENTLDYDSCNSENSGCRQYSLNGAYASQTDSVSWDAGQSVYLNKNLKVCDNADAGCTELMRLKPTWGANLIMNASFDHDAIGSAAAAPRLNDWPLRNAQAVIVNAASDPGNATGKALRLTTTASGGGLYSDSAASLLPANFQTISGQSYTLSADIYLVEGDNVSLSLGAAAEGYAKTVTDKNAWKHISVTRIADTAYNNADLFVSGYSGNGRAVFYLKNLKFEISSWDTGYADYGKFKVYEKLLPAYLEKSCYVDAVSATKDYNLKSGAPAACSDFARKCNKEEAGCELYSSVGANFAVPAQVVSSDYCSDQCLGYDVYIAKESRFNPVVSENLIPSKSAACTAEASGCNEFTNLDTLAGGGEQKEYYTSLKQCVKPTAATCATFYAWEGTDGGYQLKSYSLKSLNGLPEVTANDSALCNAAIYNLPISDAAYNPDCREFYNAAGTVSYHLISRTITCSENCHAYRLSDKNIVKNMTASQCVGADKHWNTGDNTCNVCLGGGLWDLNHNACVYQAIPGEGQTCTAQDNGCREYNGNSGNNVRLVTAYDFESGLASLWTSNCVNGLSVSTIANSKDGHSLRYADAAGSCQPVGQDAGAPVAKTRLIDRLIASDNVAAQLAVGYSVTQGSAYTVKFLARAAAPASLKIYFLNRETGARSYFNASSTVLVKGGNEWNLYQANLDNLNHTVGQHERLVISANADFLFDDFVLSEITDRYYLIKSSSQIPDVCYYDIFDKYQGAEYNLGCSQYADRGNLKHNLRQFSNLCASSAVGCEQMIDTKNYTPYGSGIWNDTNNNAVCDPTEVDCVRVSGDSAFYAVYDPAKLCSVSGKGCSRLGQGQGGAIITSWVDVYKQNNPDTYSQTLCQKDNVGCEEWQNTVDNSMSYFKNPGSNACAYRASIDPTINGKAWYKIAVKRCDANGDNNIAGTEKGSAICAGDADCGTRKCIIDNNDYPCSVSSFKTIGLGGAGNQIWTPDESAGLCEANESGCTEYIDPVSQFAANLVYNADYQTISGGKEGWGDNGETFGTVTPAATQQIVRLTPNKLYSLSVAYDAGSTGDVRLDFINGVKPLIANNTLATTTSSFTVANGNTQPVIFDSLNNTAILLSGGTELKTIIIRELVIDYQLESNVDKSSCNGLAKFDNGCVLFNERSVSGVSGLIGLEKGWDAYKTVDGATPTLCSPATPGSCTANQLVKVRPDRVCAKWLDCVTYVQDPITKQRTCYSVGECDRLNDKGECANFISSGDGTRTFDAKYDKNAAGYALINKYYLNNIKEVGLNSSAHFDFEDTIPSLSCRRDINFAATASTCVFDSNIVKDSLVRQPEGAPTDYPAHGKTYLKVPATFQISPSGSTNYITLESPAAGTTYTYYLSYMLNTKNSGLGGKVVITNEFNVTLRDARTDRPLIFTATANNGWETKVIKFDIAPGKNKVRIYLTSNATDPKESGYVYFDNINIEPVLQIGDDQYATRECRLYPSEDSLTCVNKNSNTIADGLEGYCLEHDAFNPSVCLLWYPVDKISTAKVTQSTLGYNGTYPLNYCAEANGNFDILEKRVGSRLQEGGGGDIWWNGSECTRFDFGPACASCPGGGCQDYYYLGEWDNDAVDTDKGGCFPKPENLLMITNTRSYLDVGVDCSGSYSEGWGVYDGRDITTCNNPNCMVDRNGEIITVSGNGAVVQDDSLTATPPYRVYDYDFPPASEDDLKYLSGDDPEKNFRVTCNKFIEVVDGSGENKAWTNRISRNTAYVTSTPRFFWYPMADGSYRYYGPYNAGGLANYNLNQYGRNTEGVPFGAAVWPADFDLLSSERIQLRDQYSTKNGEDVFAGRPYGCAATSTAQGCQNIGSCSLDPNVYCLVYGPDPNRDTEVAKQTCKGLGVCTPLWRKRILYNDKSANNEKYPYDNMLRNIFLKSYNMYAFVGGTYTASSGEYGDYTLGADQAEFPTGSSCTRGIDGRESFCAVWPTLGGMKLYAGDTKALIASSTGWVFNIPQRGVYRLEFNSRVDAEQQPLKKIYLDWGDGNQQIITGQDQHPTNPHVFYHYYGSNGNKAITATIYDNWGFYDSN